MYIEFISNFDNTKLNDFYKICKSLDISDKNYIVGVAFDVLGCVIKDKFSVCIKYNNQDEKQQVLKQFELLYISFWELEERLYNYFTDKGYVIETLYKHKLYIGISHEELLDLKEYKFVELKDLINLENFK